MIRLGVGSCFQHVTCACPLNRQVFSFFFIFALKMFVTQNVKIVKFVMIFAYVRVLYYIYFLLRKKKECQQKTKKLCSWLR